MAKQNKDKGQYGSHAEGQFLEVKKPIYSSPEYTDQLQYEYERKRKRGRLTLPSYMQETHLGGRIENVPGFSAMGAMTDRRSIGYKTSLKQPILTKKSARASEKTELNQDYFKPESVFHDGDDWVQVFQTGGIPWRSVCQLEITYQSGRTALGTGWFAGADTIITAGHNLYSREGDGWATGGISIIPGRSANIWPFGDTHAAAIDTLAGWTTTLDPRFDLGVIKTADSKIGLRTGWFGVTVWTDSDLLTAPIINNAGYPGISKPYGTQWFDASRIGSHSDDFIHYHLDTEPGQSGAPIFFSDFNGQRLVVATHIYGSTSSNLGLRINSNIFNTITNWIKS